MKLIRCYIENFGVLSNYSRQFQDGLNEILAPNGSGKSTLAAFLKAMFYGLPAKGPRSVTENERKRCEPWQGGACGGFLEFEYQGKPYRVTRFFGQTAAKDRCEIIDLSSHRPCGSFSSRLGEELFQLDAESFSRSVFLSGSDLSVSVTPSIRTKLSDLVENTNDLNNYDTAINSLRQKRAQLQPYRGSGGSIPKTEEALEQTREQLYAARAQRPRLDALEAEIGGKEQTLSEKNGAVRSLRQRINDASVLETRQSQRKQLLALRQEAEGFQTRLRELDGRYCEGYPSREEIDRQRHAAAELAQAERDLASTVISDEDLALYETERDFFRDPAQVSRDLDACQSCCVELEAVSARMTAQMLPEELDRLVELRERFRNDPPSEAQLSEYEALTDECKNLERRLEALCLTTEEQSRLRALSRMFAAGAPTMEQISDCEKLQQEIAGLRERKRALTLSETEQAEALRLSRVFASGVPGEEEILEQQAGRRIAELTGKKNTRAAIPQPQPGERSRAKAPLLLGVLSALLVLGGILCFIFAGQIPGILLLACGFGGGLFALALHFKAVAAQAGAAGRVLVGSAISEEENQTLFDLQHGQRDFLLRFYSDAADPDKQLAQLFSDREKYLTLGEKRERFDREREAVEREIQSREQSNSELFERFYPDQPYFDDFTNSLMLELHNYGEMKARAQEIRAERDRLLRPQPRRALFRLSSGAAEAL